MSKILQSAVIALALLASVDQAHSQSTDPTELAREIIGPTYKGTAYICPGPMSLHRVIDMTRSTPDPDESAIRMKNALKVERCFAVDGQFEIIHAFDVHEVNQGEGSELWFQLVLKDSKKRTVYGLVGWIAE